MNLKHLPFFEIAVLTLAILLGVLGVMIARLNDVQDLTSLESIWKNNDEVIGKIREHAEITAEEHQAEFRKAIVLGRQQVGLDKEVTESIAEREP